MIYDLTCCSILIIDWSFKIYWFWISWLLNFNRELKFESSIQIQQSFVDIIQNKCCKTIVNNFKLFSILQYWKSKTKSVKICSFPRTVKFLCNTRVAFFPIYAYIEWKSIKSLSVQAFGVHMCHLLFMLITYSLLAVVHDRNDIWFSH